MVMQAETAAVVMSEDQARDITERIRRTGEDFGRLLLEAHDGEAWRSMGYGSWSAYVSGEFDFTRQRSYQLLKRERINKQLAEAGSDVRVSEPEARKMPTGDAKKTRKQSAEIDGLFRAAEDALVRLASAIEPYEWEEIAASLSPVQRSVADRLSSLAQTCSDTWEGILALEVV